MFEFPGKYYEIIRKDFRSLEKETAFFSCYLPKRGRILDICCGTGTNLRPLAALGHECVGVDGSKHFIDYAREQGGEIEFAHARAVDYETNRQFDLIACVFVSLNYMPYQEIEPLFRKVKNWLAPEGHFVLDIAHLLNFVENYQPYVIAHHMDDDVLITRLVRHIVYPHEANWNHEETILVRDDDSVQMYHNAFDQLVLTVKELRVLLATVGLRIVEEYGDFDRNAPPRGRGHLVLVIRHGEEAAGAVA